MVQHKCNGTTSAWHKSQQFDFPQIKERETQSRKEHPKSCYHRSDHRRSKML